MVAFELRDVAGGWQTAAVGTADHVEFAVYDTPQADESRTAADSTTRTDGQPHARTDGQPHARTDSERPVVHTHGSLHQLLRLYDCATRERSTHPQFLGYDLTERAGTVTLDLRTGRIDTTYSELADELEAFLADVFDAIDAHPNHGTRDEHLETIAARDVALVDVPTLYDDLSSNE